MSVSHAICSKMLQNDAWLYVVFVFGLSGEIIIHNFKLFGDDSSFMATVGCIAVATCFSWCACIHATDWPTICIFIWRCVCVSGCIKFISCCTWKPSYCPLHTYLKAVIGPAAEFHHTRLLIKWKILNVNFTWRLVYRRRFPHNLTGIV